MHIKLHPVHFAVILLMVAVTIVALMACAPPTPPSESQAPISSHNGVTCFSGQSSSLELCHFPDGTTCAHAGTGGGVVCHWSDGTSSSSP